MSDGRGGHDVSDEAAGFAVGDRVRGSTETGTVQEVSERLRRARQPAVLVLLDGGERTLWWHAHELALVSADSPHDTPEGLPDDA